MIASVSLPVPPRHRLQACGARAYDVPLPALLARRLAPQTSHLVAEPHASTSSEVTFGVSVVGTAPPVRRVRPTTPAALRTTTPTTRAKAASLEPWSDPVLF